MEEQRNSIGALFVVVCGGRSWRLVIPMVSLEPSSDWLALQPNGVGMQIGIIGVGVVGGALKRWFEEFTEHDIRCHDPYKDMNDDLEGCSAVFISVPAPSIDQGQDLSVIKEAVLFAKKYTQYVFIRSTVLPGTNDQLGTISMPEFLTERRSFEDFCALPILVGPCDPKLMQAIFHGKMVVMCSNNAEAELAKFVHNCFGALKVSYFNMIYQLCETLNCDYESVKRAASMTGFIGPTHTQVPGPDGRFGYGGKCFPENMQAFAKFLETQNFSAEAGIFRMIQLLNSVHRAMPLDAELEIMA